MMREKEVRKRGWAILLAVILVVPSGCNPASSGSAKAPPNLSIKSSPADPVDARNVEAISKPQAVEFLGTFIKALAEGKASPDSLSPAFKNKIARPRHKNEEHQKLGYDPRRVDAFFNRAAEGVSDQIEALPAGSGTYFLSMGKSAGKSENCLIRLIPVDSAAGWQVDWFQRTQTMAPPFRDANLAPAQVEARIAAIAFLSTLLDGQFDLAEALMSRDYKSDLAFSTTESNKDLGYDSVLLQNLKLRMWKGTFNEFTIARQEIAEGKPAVFEGELFDGARKVRKAFVLTASKNANGEWLVEKFEP